MTLKEFTRSLVEEKRVGDSTVKRKYVSTDNQSLYAEVSYLGGRLVVEKAYPNTMSGTKELNNFFAQFKSDQDVRKYFKISEGEITVNLKQLSEEIKKNRDLAQEVIDEKGNPATLKSRIARKRAAASRLEPLYVQYKTALRSKMLFILVIGDKQEEFASIASEQGVDVQNADAFYDDLVSRLNPTLYAGREKASVFVDVLGRHLEDKAGELDISEYPQINFKQKYAKTLRSKEDALALTKLIINNEVGPEIVGLDVLEKAARRAVGEDFSDETLGIVVTLKDESMTKEIFEGLSTISSRTFLVTAGSADSKEKALVKVSEISKDTVLGALTKVAKSIKKSVKTK